MNGDHVREQLAEHLLGTLEGPEDIEVRRHLRGCAACRREMAALAEGVSTFARAAHDLEPPEPLKQRVLTVLEREWADASEATPPRRSAARLARAAVAVAVVASLGWGVVSTHRANHFEAAARTYENLLGKLGGKSFRVGRLSAAGQQQLSGSVVMYDSGGGQSWALVLVQAPGLRGTAQVVLSSGSHTIRMRPLQFGPGGDASTWLVTSSSLRAFNRVTVFDPTGAVLAAGSVSQS